MNETLDKLTPGRHAKLCLAMDLCLVLAGIALSTSWEGEFIGAAVMSLMLCGVAGWGIAISILRLYSPYTPRRTLDQVVLALLAATSIGAGLLLVDRLFLGAPPFHFSPTVFSSFVGIGVVITQLVVFRPLAKTETPKSDVLIVGTGALGVASFRRLSEPRRHTNVVGFVTFDGDRTDLPRDVDAPILGTTADMPEILKAFTLDEIYLAGEVMHQGRDMQKLVKTFEELGIPFAVPLHSLRFNRAQLLSTSRASDGYLHYLNTKPRPFQWAIKRLADIFLASLGLILLSPLMLIVAAIIKLGDGGPVFFRQDRVGLHGATFTFLKFRSMVMNAEALKDELMKFNEQTGPAFKMKHDPRITKVGRFIRKYSIDELPQLINILRGDMTIVGPRPPVPREVAEYKPWHRRRLSVRPGLTCYWQVGGRNEIGFEEWMLLDLRYVDHWSLVRDVELILKTIPVVLLGRGAS